MNQHLLVTPHPHGVANSGNSFAKADPMSEASALAAAMGVGLTRIGALIWHLFPTQLNDSELIHNSLGDSPGREFGIAEK